MTHKAHTLRKLVLRVMRPGNRHKSELHSCLYDRLASLSQRERDRMLTLCEEMTDPWKREAASAALIWDLQTKLGITPLSVQEIKAYLQWLVQTNRVPSAAVPRTAIFHAHGLDHSGTSQYFYHALSITGGTNDACPVFELDGPHWSLEPTWVHAPRHTEESALSSWTSIGFGCFGTDLQCPLVTILGMCRDSGMYDLNMNTMKLSTTSTYRPCRQQSGAALILHALAAPTCTMVLPTYANLRTNQEPQPHILEEGKHTNWRTMH